MIHLINGYEPDWVQPDGSYRLSKTQLAELYGIDYYGILVSNRTVADGYDDYAERTFIWGGTEFMLGADVCFVIDASGNQYIENMAILTRRDDNFDFEGIDLATNIGNAALEHAIDPSGIGATVSLVFGDYVPEAYTYTFANYQADLTKQASWTEPSHGEQIAAMQSVVDSLWSDGVTQFLHGDKPIIYGTAEDDYIANSFTQVGYDLAAPSGLLGLIDLDLHVYVQNGIIYQAGSGHDFVFGSSGDDVAYGGDGNDVMDGFDGSDILIGGQGADQRFGGGADDFIFFDAEDTVVNGGAGRDVGVALGQGGMTVNMTAQELEVVIGGGGADTVTASGGTEPLFAAGGGGDDTFSVTFDDAEGPKVHWGGAGADTFDFFYFNPENYREQLGIAVVQIAGLTEKIFAGLTLDDLGLGGIDLSQIDTIILNPDAGDAFNLFGSPIDNATVDPDLYADSGGTVFGLKVSSLLGGSHTIQSLFQEEVWIENEYHGDRKY